MGWSDSIDQILVSRSSRPHHCIFGLLLLVFLVDIASSIFLRLSPAVISGEHVSWAPKDFVHALTDFRSDTLDIIVLSLLRPAILAVLVWIAIKLGTPRLGDLVRSQDALDTCHTCTVTSTAPLLINEGPTASINGGGSVPTTSINGGGSGPSTRSGSAAAAGLTLTTDVKEEHLKSHERKERAVLRKNVVCAVMFLFTSGVQVYVGIKCIGFDQGWRKRPTLHTVQALIFLASLALINFESFLAKRFVMVCTQEEGHLVPEFHPHRLYFNPKIPGHRCDMCRNKINQAYVCRLCDFDCCAACFNKKDKATGEGIIRGDKGVKHVGTLSMGTYMYRGARLIAPELPLFIVALTLLGANSMIRLFMPNYQGSIIQDIINAHHACVNEAYNLTVNVTRGECAAHKASFLDNVLVYLALSFATSILTALRQLAFMLVARRVILHIRGRVFDSILNQDIAFFDGMRTGDLQQRCTSDVRQTASPIFSSLPLLLSNIILLVGGVVMCFVTSWRLSMLAFTTALPIMHVTRAYAEWSSKINRAIVQDLSDGNAITNEAISNVRTVRSVSSEDFERARYRVTLQKGFSKGIRDATIGSLATFFNGSLDMFAGVMILWYGGSIAVEADGEITVGDLIKYQLYYNMMNNSIQALSGVLNTFTRAAGAAERVLTVIDLPPDIPPDKGDKVGDAISSWDLILDNVHFYYQMRPTNPVLQGLSFEVPAGSVCALVGTSGGGKSTVMHMLLRFYDPHEGRITLGGRDYKELNLKSMHEQIGVVSQDTQLWNCSVGENITYGAPDDVPEAEIELVARAAQAWEFITEFEDGFHTKVGERGQRLSGGQRQRIAIARCLLRKPKLLLLDEATSALDAESEAAVQKALEALMGRDEQSTVLVAHRLSTVVNAHQIIVVDKGRAAERGTHAKLLDEGGKYADLVRTQLQKGQQEEDTAAPASAPQRVAAGAGARAEGAGGLFGTGLFANPAAPPSAPGEVAAAVGRQRRN